MARFSSKDEADRIRAINQRMTGELLEKPAQPLLEGAYALRVLESRGRVSGTPRPVPIGVLLRGHRHYLVSPDPSRDWVRNLANDPRCALRAGGESTSWRAVAVDGDEAADAVGGYLSAVTTPWALRAFPVAADASHEEILEHLGSIAVFRLEPADD